MPRRPLDILQSALRSLINKTGKRKKQLEIMKIPCLQDLKSVPPAAYFLLL